MGKVVAIGDYGSQVFTCFEGANASARMLSAYASGTTTAIWQSAPVHEVLAAKVDAAASSDVFVSLTLQRVSATAPLQLVLTRYRAASAVPVWQRTLPLAAQTGTKSGLALSNDASSIVTWAFDTVQMNTKVFVYSSTGDLVKSQTVHTTFAPMGGTLSADGRLLYLTAPHWDIVVDLQTSQFPLQALIGPSVGEAMDMSADGGMVASSRGEGVVQVYRREGTAYVPWFSVTPQLAMTLCTQIGISADGSTLVCGFRNPFQAGALKLQVYDLSSAAHPLITEVAFPSVPAYVYFTALDLSTDGHLIVAGTTGDVGGPVPELVTLERTGNAWTQSDVNLPCAVTDVTMRAGTRMFAVSANGISAAAGYQQWGELRLYDAGVHDVRIDAVPRAGTTLTIEHTVGANTAARMLMSLGMAATPTVFPTAGTLYLSAPMISIGGGIAGADGVVATSFTLPGGPDAIGQTFCFQGVRFSPRTMSQDALKVTVLP